MGIEALFASGEVGVWYDPSDLSSMWQDTAGTIPVTAAGQSVARVDDKSGNGLHATQSVTSQRPVLAQDAGGRYYLYFDGVDDVLATAALNLTGTTSVTALAGIEKYRDTPGGVVFETSLSSYSNAGTIGLFAPSNPNVGQVLWRAYAGIRIDVSKNGYPTPSKMVITGLSDALQPISALRVDGVQQASSTASQGAVAFGSNALYIGGRPAAAVWFRGAVYGLVIRAALTAGSLLTDAESWMAAKMAAGSATGTASGALDLSGSAQGQASVQGAASGALDIAAAGTGQAEVRGQASGSLDVAGSGNGISRATGQASGSLDVGSTAEGRAEAHGQASGSLGISGTAVGTVTTQEEASGSASGTVDIGASGTGQAEARGQASGQISISGSAEGNVEADGGVSWTFKVTAVWKNNTFDAKWLDRSIIGEWRAA